MSFAYAQDVKNYIYKGNIGDMPITLYLQKEVSGCGPIFYRGMYQYDKKSKWLYLEISDDEENKLVMVEGGITGILSLKINGNNLNGFWIAPDGNKKLNVTLKNTNATKKNLESLQVKFEELNYEMNEC